MLSEEADLALNADLLLAFVLFVTRGTNHNAGETQVPSFMLPESLLPLCSVIVTSMSTQKPVSIHMPCRCARKQLVSASTVTCVGCWSRGISFRKPSLALLRERPVSRCRVSGQRVMPGQFSGPKGVATMPV